MLGFIEYYGEKIDTQGMSIIKTSGYHWDNLKTFVNLQNNAATGLILNPGIILISQMRNRQQARPLMVSQVFAEKEFLGATKAHNLFHYFTMLIGH